MSIDIQWSVDPRPDDRWNSSVLVVRMPDKNPQLTKLTDRQEARLDLMVNHLYEILVTVRLLCPSIIYYSELLFSTFATYFNYLMLYLRPIVRHLRLWLYCGDIF